MMANSGGFGAMSNNSYANEWNPNFSGYAQVTPSFNYYGGTGGYNPYGGYGAIGYTAPVAYNTFGGYGGYRSW